MTAEREAMMNRLTDNELQALIDQAIAGDKQSLETLLLGVQDLVFNLSLRMLGTFQDAEDASQDILLKVMTHLSSFKREQFFYLGICHCAESFEKL